MTKDGSGFDTALLTHFRQQDFSQFIAGTGDAAGDGVQHALAGPGAGDLGDFPKRQRPGLLSQCAGQAVGAEVGDGVHRCVPFMN